MTTEYISPKQIEAFEKFFKKLPHGKDLTLVVLKGHLLLEEQIRAVVDERLQSPLALKDARLDCHQIICLAESLCPKDTTPNLWKAAKKLNTLRNNIAHSLDPKGLEHRVADFVQLFPSGLSEKDEPMQEQFEKSLLSLFVLMSHLTEKQISELL
jgi:hypothetical protein